MLPLTIAAIVLVIALDWVTGPWVNVQLLYCVGLIVAAGTRSRSKLWTCLGVLTLGSAGIFILEAKPLIDKLGESPIYNRVLTSVYLVLIAYVLDLWIRRDRVAEQRKLELQDRNEQLARHDEEIARQNEELQSQTEELERQSEELRLTNDELSRRENMLQSLLELSRSLTADLSPGQTMERICHVLGELVNGGPGTAAAIEEKRGDEMVVVCHSGFGGGLECDAIPYTRAFASLVLERGRTGFIEDVNLRPDLTIPQPKSGPKHVAVIAAPLRVGGRVTGSLEVYSTQKHTWSDEQIALIESLAAQTSISLEAAHLFEEIDHQRRRLETILRTLPIGVSIGGEDANSVRFNPAGAAILSLPADTNLPLTEIRNRWKMFRDGTELEPSQQPMTRALQSGDGTAATEIEMVSTHDGRRVTLLNSSAPVRDRDDKLVGAVSAFVDITQLKRLQRELDARRREAEESSARKTRFLAAVSHDIRTPANAIGLLGELLQRAGENPAMAGEIPNIALQLRRSALALVNLVTDVLDLTRMDAGKIDLVESEFDLGELVRDECDHLRALAREKSLVFECLANHPIRVRADRIKMGRVLQNLLGNAIKFTDSGQVRAEVLTESGVQSGVQIRVTDTGRGIPADVLPRIFDEFFQLKSRTDDRSGSSGSGLGLTICKRLIEAMGGTLTAESEVGKGSIFTVTLPPVSIVRAHPA